MRLGKTHLEKLPPWAGAGGDLPTYLTQRKTRNRQVLGGRRRKIFCESYGDTRRGATIRAKCRKSISRGKGGRKGDAQCFRCEIDMRLARGCRLSFQKRYRRFLRLVDAKGKPEIKYYALTLRRRMKKLGREMRWETGRKNDELGIKSERNRRSARG